jgi:hypothetical protein
MLVWIYFFPKNPITTSFDPPEIIDRQSKLAKMAIRPKNISGHIKTEFA